MTYCMISPGGNIRRHTDSERRKAELEALGYREQATERSRDKPARARTAAQ